LVDFDDASVDETEELYEGKSKRVIHALDRSLSPQQRLSPSLSPSPSCSICAPTSLSMTTTTMAVVVSLSLSLSFLVTLTLAQCNTQ
jgi:hypothetical protein